MILKLKLSAAMMSAVLAAGCATKPEPVFFLSAASLPKHAPAATTPTGSLSKSDEQKIEVLVFSELLKGQLGEGGGYAALFLQADNEEVTAMIRKFPNHNPPLKPAKRLNMHSAKLPLDRDTGLPVMILSVEVNEPNADGSVSAVGRWFAGATEKGSRPFVLKKAGDDWVITSGQ